MTKNMLAALAVAGFATAVLASVTFDPQTGIGFAGKGDVQLTFGWNNTKLQKNADSVAFQTSRIFVTETTWTCSYLDGNVTFERVRTTTRERTHLLDTVARLRNQITGFKLEGYAAPTETVVLSAEGPSPGACPDLGPLQGTTVDLTSPQVTDPGTLTLQVQSTGPNPVDWTDIVSPAP